MLIPEPGNRLITPAISGVCFEGQPPFFEFRWGFARWSGTYLQDWLRWELLCGHVWAGRALGLGTQWLWPAWSGRRGGRAWRAERGCSFNSAIRLDPRSTCLLGGIWGIFHGTSSRFVKLYEWNIPVFRKQWLPGYQIAGTCGLVVLMKKIIKSQIWQIDNNTTSLWK